MKPMKMWMMSGLLILGLLLQTGCGGGSSDEGTPEPSGQTTLGDLQQQAEQALDEQEADVGKAVEDAKEEVKLSEVDAEREIGDIKAEAEKMNDESLRAMAEKYKEAFKAKQAEFNKVEEKIKGMSVAELASGGAKGLKDESTSLLEELSALRERFEVYLDQLKANGVDVSDIDF